MKVDDNIIKRYLEGDCNEAEKALVEEWFEQYDGGTFSDEELEKAVASLDGRMKDKISIPFKMKWSIAAVFALFICVGLYLYRNLERRAKLDWTYIEDIKAPKTLGAILEINNKELNVNDIQLGDTCHIAGFTLLKDHDGILKYLEAPSGNVSGYQRIRVSEKSIATIELLDGTRIWLNGGAEMRYNMLTLQDRDVQLKGEAYFEVNPIVSNGDMIPFFVRGSDQTVAVLGTKFNVIFSKKQEVALLEGKVGLTNSGSKLNEKIESLSKMTILKPNEVYNGKEILRIKNIEDRIKWTNNSFELDKMNLYTLADELSRWYDVPVHVEKGLPENLLFGSVSRSKDLNDILQIVSKALPINYELRDRQIWITKRSVK